MLRVNRNGSKSWYVQLNRTQKRKIGDAKLMTAAIARYRARDILVAHRAAATAQKYQQSTLKLDAYLCGRYTDWKASMSPWAKRDIRRLCNALGELGRMSINEVGVSHLERWKLKRVVKVKPATANRELAALRAALNKAVGWGLINSNPAQQVKNARYAGKSTTRVLNDEDRARLYGVLDSRDDHMRPLVYLALNTGLTRGEIFNLRWRDVNLGPAPSVMIETTGRAPGFSARPVTSVRHQTRRLPLNQLAAEELRRWQNHGGRWGPLVFRNSSGGRLRSVKTAWSALMKAAAIRNFEFRDCRHDFAARLVAAGSPLGHVRDLLGHSTITLTERYARFSPGSLKESVALLNLVH